MEIPTTNNLKGDGVSGMGYRSFIMGGELSALSLQLWRIGVNMPMEIPIMNNLKGDGVSGMGYRSFIIGGELSALSLQR